MYNGDNKIASTSQKIISEALFKLLKDFCYCYSIYLNNNFDFIKLIIDNNLSETLYEGFYTAFISCKKILPEQYESIREHVAIFVASGLTSIAKTCVMNGFCESSDSIENLTYSLFSGMVFNK